MAGWENQVLARQHEGSNACWPIVPEGQEFTSVSGQAPAAPTSDMRIWTARTVKTETAPAIQAAPHSLAAYGRTAIGPDIVSTSAL